MKKLLSILCLTTGTLFSQTVIFSDGSWKGTKDSTANIIGGDAWKLPGYNDASWSFVEAPNAGNVIPVVTGSQSIWANDSNFNTRDTVYVRKTFNVPVGDSYTVSVEINADNEFQVYFNGIYMGGDDWWPDGPFIYTISNATINPTFKGCDDILTASENVIAVRAINWDYPAPYGVSLKATITTNNPLDVPLATPAGNPACTAFDASWDAVASADGYLLDVSEDPTFANFFDIYHDFNTGSVTSQNISGITPGTTYYYRLRSVRGSLISCYSNVISVLPNVAISVNSPTICAGETATLFAAGGTTYTWSAGATSTGTNTATASPSTTTTYTVTETTTGCSASAIATVTVNQLPSVTINSPSVCPGQTANLTAGGANTYTWAGVASFSGNTATVTPTSTSNYTVNGTNTATGCSNTAVSTVTIHQLPTITVNSPTICSGKTANLIAGGADTYTWSTGITAIGTNTATVTPASDIAFTVTGTDANGCIASSVGNVTIAPNPTADFITSNETTIKDPTVNFTSTSSGAATWLWDFGNGSTSDIENPVYRYTEAGTYDIWLYVTSDLGCLDSISYPIKIEDLLTVFLPNAFSPNGNGLNDKFNIHSNEVGLENFELKIFDRWGNVVFRTNDINEGWNGKVNNTGAPAVMDVYAYQVNYTGLTGKKNQLLGAVTLVK